MGLSIRDFKVGEIVDVQEISKMEYSKGGKIVHCMINGYKLMMLHNIEECKNFEFTFAVLDGENRLLFLPDKKFVHWYTNPSDTAFIGFLEELPEGGFQFLDYELKPISKKFKRLFDAEIYKYEMKGTMQKIWREEKEAQAGINELEDGVALIEMVKTGDKIILKSECWIEQAYVYIDEEQNIIRAFETTRVDKLFSPILNKYSIGNILEIFLYSCESSYYTNLPRYKMTSRRNEDGLWIVDIKLEQ
ncbi:MAG: hypothetical protein Q4G05_03925 [Clostridia bacterium]|nr:hypothetical protein [Clostridia bacterium]